jgi:hypothetical protein
MEARRIRQWRRRGGRGARREARKKRGGAAGGTESAARENPARGNGGISPGKRVIRGFPGGARGRGGAGFARGAARGLPPGETPRGGRKRGKRGRWGRFPERKGGERGRFARDLPTNLAGRALSLQTSTPAAGSAFFKGAGGPGGGKGRG